MSFVTLKKYAEFQAHLKQGYKWVTPAFVLYALDRPLDSNDVIYGLIASKKLGKAVVRNRCKRRLRALLHLLHQQDLQCFHGRSYVLVARSVLADYDFEQLRKDLKWALRRIGPAHDS